MSHHPGQPRLFTVRFLSAVDLRLLAVTEVKCFDGPMSPSQAALIGAADVGLIGPRYVARVTWTPCALGEGGEAVLLEVGAGEYEATPLADALVRRGGS